MILKIAVFKDWKDQIIILPILTYSFLTLSMYHATETESKIDMYTTIVTGDPFEGDSRRILHDGIQDNGVASLYLSRR